MTARQAWAAELKAARLRAGFAYRKDLAIESGVSKDTVDQLEQGKRMPRQDTLMMLRRVLPDLRTPLEVSTVGDERDPNGYAVHLPMDPGRRIVVLAELMQMAVREERERSTRRDD